MILRITRRFRRIGRKGRIRGSWEAPGRAREGGVIDRGGGEVNRSSRPCVIILEATGSSRSSHASARLEMCWSHSTSSRDLSWSPRTRVGVCFEKTETGRGSWNPSWLVLLEDSHRKEIFWQVLPWRIGWCRKVSYKSWKTQPRFGDGSRRTQGGSQTIDRLQNSGLGESWLKSQGLHISQVWNS